MNGMELLSANFSFKALCNSIPDCPGICFSHRMASTFSFYVGHHMSTIEGGAICTDDSELADMLSLVRAHGWDRNLEFTKQKEIRKKFKVNSTFYSRYTFYDLGFNLMI